MKPELKASIVRLLETVAAKRSRDSRLTMAAAAALFFGGLVFALWNLPPIRGDADWALLALVPLVGVPLTVWASALEYQISVDIAGHRTGAREALRVSVLASAANLLPIPGSVIVRTGAMRRLGASTGTALIAAAVVGIGWVGISAALTGAFLLAADERDVGSVSLLAGIVLLATTYLLVRTNLHTRTQTVMTRIIVVEALSVSVKAFRLYVILHAFGFDVGLAEAMVLALAAVIVTALGFFPAGLGATEVLTAAMSPLVDVPAALGLLAAAADRILGLVMLGLMAMALLRGRAGAAQPGSTAPPEQGPSS